MVSEGNDYTSLEVSAWFVLLSAVIMECLMIKYQVSSQCWPHGWCMQ